jgi:hypothetical protein
MTVEPRIARAPAGTWVRAGSRNRSRHSEQVRRVEVRSATLMPPIARLVAPWSYHLAAALQGVPVLRTHIMAFISAPPGVVRAS